MLQKDLLSWDNCPPRLNKKVNLSFKNNDPAHTGFQFLEDLSTAYWYSEVFFTAIELGLFQLMEKGSNRPDQLAREAQCQPDDLLRLLTAMERMGLITCYKDCFYNSQVASLYLIPGSRDYLGDFFLYRKYMLPQWEALTEKVSAEKRKADPSLSYSQRNYRYVSSMDVLVKLKAREIIDLIHPEKIHGPILDVGGGAGSLLREIQNKIPRAHGVLFDIPEVIEAAQKLYPDDTSWEKITPVTGDFRKACFDTTFGVICLSNFLHAYGAEEAEELLLKSVSLLDEDGLLLIHDYFPDRHGIVPQKGALYDLNMMLNTYNGRCHDSRTIIQWCKRAGLKEFGTKDLETDTAVILARRSKSFALADQSLKDYACGLGLDDLIAISPQDVVTAPWAREKCRFGCDCYGQNLQCPPSGMDDIKTRQILDSYTTAYLVKGAPPGKAFHLSLLSLEKKMFLDGFQKAFVYSAGPCTLCPQCPDNGECVQPHLARPSMEGSGIDVYATVEKAGLRLKPVQEKGQYVTYYGLLLVE